MVRAVLQSEASECGLACLAIVLSHYGQAVQLYDLRQRIGSSFKGTSLKGLIQQAALAGLNARPLKLSLTELHRLSLPCVLHWDMNHFVVLSRVRRTSVTVIDPAVGERRLRLNELSQHFTGVALELTPSANFKLLAPVPRLRLAALTGKVVGLWRSLVQIFIVAVVLELFAIASPLMQQVVVDEVLTSGDRDLLTVLALGFGMLLVIQTFIGLARSWMVLVLGQTLSLQWASNVFTHLLKLPIAFFERRHLGDITSRFGAVQVIQRTLTTAVIEALLDGLMAVGALVMMLVYSPSLTAVTASAVLTYGLLRWASYRPLRNAAAERLVVAAKESSHFLETLRAMTPLKLFNCEEQRCARWQNLLVEVQNRDIRTATMSMGFGTANVLIFGLEHLVVLWLGAEYVLNTMTGRSGGLSGELTIGMLFAFLSYKTQFATRMSALINYAVDLKMLGLHAERLADICLEAPEKDSIRQNDLSHLAPSIELRGVSFRYAEGEPWIFKDVNFKIEAGESVALIGPSGAGKTTLLKVALGLLKPSEGEIFYGGQKITSLGIQNFRRQIGTVMQEDVLLTGSLEENIAFFDVQPDRARVELCASMAQLHEDIRRMPMGYETLVGDLGTGLSGGQKQRLLLARALYKQPRVLALDEATSHLDGNNERAVTAAIAHIPLTRLIIAHRAETIAGASRVVQILPTPLGVKLTELTGAEPASLSAKAV